MANIPKDERQVNRAQKLYDQGVDQYLNIIEDLNKNIPDIYDIIQGYRMARPEERYQLTSSQYGALKDHFNLWLSNVQNPEKALAHINNELKKKYSKQKHPEGTSSNKPKLAVFSPTAR